MRRSRRFWVVVAVLYAITWVGGCVSHQRSLSARARHLYEDAQVRERAVAAQYKQEGGIYQPRRITRDGGPIASVNWCFPLLPAILVVDSYYVVGPLYGRGGVSIILFYGFGCYQLGPIGGWIS